MTKLNNREKEILKILTEDSEKGVTDISEMLGVSAVTIRSDFKALADKGYIVRTRGGAFPAFHPSIVERQKKQMDEKERIAKAAAAMINDGENVIIVAGTTTSLIGKYLLGKRDVHIVTNSTLIFPFIRTNPSVRVTIVGGEFRASSEAILGPIATQGMKHFHVDKAFLGTDGFTVEQGITADIVEMAEIVKIASEHSSKRILLADSSKYGRAGFAHIMNMENLDHLITDESLPADALSKLKKAKLTVKQV